MNVFIACTTLVLIIVAMIIAYVFRSLKYGIIQSIFLGLMITIPFSVSIVLDGVNWTMVKFRDLILILGGTDYDEMAKRWSEMIKNEES
jgi:predicted RND superfamily exporter protein